MPWPFGKSRELKKHEEEYAKEKANWERKVKQNAQEAANAASKGLVKNTYFRESLGNGGRPGNLVVEQVVEWVTPEVAQQRQQEREREEERKGEVHRIFMEKEMKVSNKRKIAECKALIAQAEAEDATTIPSSGGKRFFTKKNKKNKKKRKTRRV